MNTPLDTIASIVEDARAWHADHPSTDRVRAWQQRKLLLDDARRIATDALGTDESETALSWLRLCELQESRARALAGMP